MITILHEAWETFVKKAYAMLLFKCRSEVSPPKRARFHQHKKNWRDYKDTEKYFEDYASWACKRDTKEAEKSFRKHLDWNLVHVKEGCGMEWFGLCRTLAFCRHAIVHSDGRVTKAELTELSKREREFVQRMMKPTILSDESRLRPDEETVSSLIVAMCSFAFCLYVLVCLRCGYKVETYPWNPKGNNNTVFDDKQ